MPEDAPPPADHTASERYGPLVHRSVRHGAILLIVASLVFIGANAVTQVGYGSSYSLTQNYISDLGAVHCGTFNFTGSLGSGTKNVCSPWHDVFNIGIIVMGLLIILSMILIRTAFPARRSRTIGLGLFMVAGIGAIGVGIFPEDVNLTFHSLFALLAFAGAGLALLVLGLAMLRDTRWDGFRAYTFISGLVDLAALVFFGTKNYSVLGVGGMERLIVAPVLLWAIVAGLHLARIPTYAPRVLPKTTNV